VKVKYRSEKSVTYIGNKELNIFKNSKFEIIIHCLYENFLFIFLILYNKSNKLVNLVIF